MRLPLVRALVAADGPDALEFWKGLPGLGLSPADEPAALARFWERNPGLSFGAFDGDGPRGRRLVGTCLAGHDGRRGFVYHFAVDPAFRNLGLGSRLLQASLDGLAAEGLQKVHLFVLADNAAGLEFWSHAGVRGWKRRGDLVVFSRDL